MLGRSDMVKHMVEPTSSGNGAEIRSHKGASGVSMCRADPYMSKHLVTDLTFHC